MLDKRTGGAKPMKKSKAVETQSNARGYCVIPADRLDMVTKVVKRLQKDGISFLMEDMEADCIRELYTSEGRYEGSRLKDHVEVRFTPATRIIWPDPEPQSDLEAAQ
jgi:hypothetical protein